MCSYANFSKKKQAAQSGGSMNMSLPDSYSHSKPSEIKNIDEWATQILYWRSHLDVFIEDYLSTEDNPIKFEGFQKVIVRQAGNCTTIRDCESRGAGKTWKAGLILFSLGILYPDSKILIVSGTVSQAINTINYIESLASNNENMRREIKYPISISRDRAEIRLLNGTTITARAMGKDGSGIRGQRAKIVYIDEAILVSNDVIDSVLKPVMQYKRPVWWKMKDQGFEDYPSKLIETTSAYLKEVDFYQRFKNSLMGIRRGDTDKFICCISYETLLRLGMIDESKIEDDKSTMDESIFDMEYRCKFIGSDGKSFFPYDVTSKARVLKDVELYQPQKSTARYVISLDVATSDKDFGDNACLTVVKFIPNKNGFTKQVVYMATYKGHDLKDLAIEVRKMMIRFPNTEKVVVDNNAIGEGVVSYLQDVYVDTSGDKPKEYPPIIPDTAKISDYNDNALPILWAYRGNNELNNRGAMAMKMFFENGSLQLPVSSLSVKNQNIEAGDKKSTRKTSKEMLLEEKSVYVNIDALLIELSNIKTIVLASGIKYDVTSSAHHKDRYSSLMMALLYIYNLEDDMKKKKIKDTGNECMGMVFSF